MIYSLAVSQKEGDQWTIGYYSLGSPNYSVMNLDFSKSALEIEFLFNEQMQMGETSSNICSANGNAIIWTNGMQIFGRNGITISDTIAFEENPFGYWNYFYSSDYGPLGFPQHDGALILPVPDGENLYSVIYHIKEPHPLWGFALTKFLEARVRINLDSTFTLMYKDSLIEPYHQWFTGPILATRHANGRDWWIITMETNGSGYFTNVLDPNGIRFDHQGTLGMEIKFGLDLASFSFHGNYMARTDAISPNEGGYVTLFSFDRCTGDLERLNTFHIEFGFFTGVAFSPSERYLYADDNKHLWQWDLWSDDIPASQTLVDTFDGFVQPGWFETQFGPMKSAPDGRIYIVPPAGSSEYMHVIDRPDLPAAECRFLQHHINLTVPNGRSAPNLPNFRLGPLDESSCDTLGLNNHPVARWRYEEDNPSFLFDIRFTDLSFYDPQTWLWDFDDGSTSSTPSPVHTFIPGLYHVCLTVSNQYDTDSTCQWIEILPTATDDVTSSFSDLTISPNPFSNEISIQSHAGVFRPAHIQLYDVNGKLVFDQANIPVPINIFLPNLSPGMYMCVITEKDGIVYNAKLMKM
ncbi:MAG: PKD domain-containing protein [Saprospiraceae bacterium]